MHARVNKSDPKEKVKKKKKSGRTRRLRWKRLLKSGSVSRVWFGWKENYGCHVGNEEKVECERTVIWVVMCVCVCVFEAGVEKLVLG